MTITNSCREAQWVYRSRKHFPNKSFKRGQLVKNVRMVKRLEDYANLPRGELLSIHLPWHLKCDDKPSFQVSALFYSMILLDEQDFMLLKELDSYRKSPTININED